MTEWSAGMIGSAISRQFFQRKCIVLVDNCYWTGHEADLLGVSMDRRLIDIEVKISRADLKADSAKDKWWHRVITGCEPYFDKDGKQRGANAVYSSTAREWPPKVWKHYYALPADIWKPELTEALPSANSGILLLRQNENGYTGVECVRRSKPNKDAMRLTEAQCLDIARLANLRMWDAYATNEKRAATHPEG